jgi:dihydrodipicolinate synthase/N-acetylneuraminate lyase
MSQETSSITPAPPLCGVLPVFQTPFHDDESIDFGTLERELTWLFDRGADGIVMAMVSETLRLSSDEREALAAAACRIGRGRGAVVISVGAESAHTAERFARQAATAGAHAVMAIPPISIGLSDDELLRYYERLIRAVPIPVVVQDASGYVGRPMSIALQARLLDEFGDRVLYKPEAAPIGPRLTALRDATGGCARIFEGSGGIALVESHRRGIVGTMPGAEIIDAQVALWRALEAGDRQRVDRLYAPVCALVAMQNSLDAYLAVEKHLLVKQGIFKNAVVRGPVGYRLDEVTRAEVDHWFARLQEAIAS